MTRALWALLALFVLRVVGQLLVAIGVGSFLPSWEEWFSGAVPYPWLLASQLLIIVLLGRVCLDLSFRRGFFAVPRPALGSLLRTLGSIYALAMVVRYAVRMGLYPHERWTGGAIPIFFHLVLASFVLVLGAYHRRAGDEWRQDSRRPIANAVLVSLRALGAIGILSWVAFQLAPLALSYSLGARRPEYAVRIDRGVAMRTSDGVRLRADVYRPVHVEKAPTILVRIPFSKTLNNSLFATIVGRFWAERGYAAVIQGTRGRYASEGRYYPLRHERQDGLETLAWLATQPWFDGRIGTWGGSAFGHTQWALADALPASRGAMMVQISSTDFHGMFHPGGAFALRSALYWAMRSHGPEDVRPDDAALERGALTLPLTDADEAAGTDVPFFDDWLAHPERDAYWEIIDGDDRAASVSVPVHVMAGWYDPFLPTQLRDFSRIRTAASPEVARESRLVIGPWGHAQSVTFPDGYTPRNYRLASLAPSIPWFDRHVRRQRPDATTSSPVRIYVMGANMWREEQEWPLARARHVSYYLRSGGRANSAAGDGQLTTDAPATSEPADAFEYDPQNPVPTRGGAELGTGGGIVLQNDVEDRADVLVYTTPPLDRDTEVTGEIVARLYVATTAPSTDFTAKLVDVRPDGAAYNVTDGILRRDYTPRVDPARASPELIDVRLWPTSVVFRRGHRIRLEVSSSNFPRFDRNLNSGEPAASAARAVAATQALHHGRERASQLVLPIVP